MISIPAWVLGTIQLTISQLLDFWNSWSFHLRVSCLHIQPSIYSKINRNPFSDLWSAFLYNFLLSRILLCNFQLLQGPWPLISISTHETIMKYTWNVSLGYLFGDVPLGKKPVWSSGSTHLFPVRDHDPMSSVV